MLAYYARSATREFWAEHWGAQSPAVLARSAEHSPLTAMILQGMPPIGASVLAEVDTFWHAGLEIWQQHATRVALVSKPLVQAESSAAAQLRVNT